MNEMSISPARAAARARVAASQEAALAVSEVRPAPRGLSLALLVLLPSVLVACSGSIAQALAGGHDAQALVLVVIALLFAPLPLSLPALLSQTSRDLHAARNPQWGSVRQSVAWALGSTGAPWVVASTLGILGAIVVAA